MLFQLPKILDSVYKTNKKNGRKTDFELDGFKQCMDLVNYHFDKNSEQLNLHLENKRLNTEIQFLESDKKSLEKRIKQLEERNDFLLSDINFTDKKSLKSAIATNIVGICNKKTDIENIVEEIRQLCNKWIK